MAGGSGVLCDGRYLSLRGADTRNSAVLCEFSLGSGGYCPFSRPGHKEEMSGLDGVRFLWSCSVTIGRPDENRGFWYSRTRTSSLPSFVKDMKGGV